MDGYLIKSLLPKESPKDEDFSITIPIKYKDMNNRERRHLTQVMMDLHEMSSGPHYNIPYAKMEVKEMSHRESDQKIAGEKYPISHAEEIYNRYKKFLPVDTTIADIYVAINYQYHKYAYIYKTWIKDSIDSKIIDSAIIFWFGDEDFPEGDKLWRYFKLM